MANTSNFTLPVKPAPAHTRFMATPVLIPVSEYLATSYDPDCDYIDGEVQERNMGEGPHSLLQSALLAIFYANRRTWKATPLPEQRVQTSATRYRIPDICLVTPGTVDRIIVIPPILCVEIISSGQTIRQMQDRTDDYLAMGVRQVWVFDPILRQAFLPDSQGTLQPASGILSVKDTPIALPLDEIFREYDDLAAGH
jgi:Uma2 family endonuclease